MSTEAQPPMEEVDLQGRNLVEKVKELIHEGNVRRILIKDPTGKTVIEIPVTVGVIGVVAAPVLAAVGGLAAIAADYSIEVERQDPDAALATDAMHD